MPSLTAKTVPTLAFLGLWFGSAGCQLTPERPEPGRRVVNPSDPIPTNTGRATAQMFAPALIRVHPLSHVAREQDGTVSLILHMEVQDNWRDVVKGAGVLRAQIFQPGSSAIETSQASWQVNLVDPTYNAVFWDVATRTYRVPLTELPMWVEQMAPPEGGGARPGGDGRLRLLVTFETLDTQGEPLTLRDEYVIRQ